MTKDWHTPEQIVSELGKMRHAEVRLSAGPSLPVAVCSVVDPASHHPCATLIGKSCAYVHEYVVAWVDIGPNRLWMICTETSNPSRG